jgi:hypothetical protein
VVILGPNIGRKKINMRKACRNIEAWNMELDHIADENGAVVGQQEVLSAMPRSTARPAEEGNITEAVDQRPHQGGLSRRSVKKMSYRWWEKPRFCGQ